MLMYLFILLGICTELSKTKQKPLDVFTTFPTNADDEDDAYEVVDDDDDDFVEDDGPRVYPYSLLL